MPELKSWFHVLAARCAQAVPEVVALMKTEGAGKTGCALHPRSRVRFAQNKMHTRIQVQRKHSGLPCAMALRLISCSPRRTALLPPSLRPTSALLGLAQLDASTAASGPHDFAVRSSALVSSASASTATRPTFVTMANAPLCGTGWLLM